MPENSKKLQVLKLLTNNEDSLEESPDSDSEILADKPPVKKPRSEAQKLAFVRARKIKMTNAENRKIVADLAAKEQLKVYEEKVVKKAIAIKKREVKKHAGLDKIPDDDTPLEEITAISKSKPKQAVKTEDKPILPIPVKYIFV